MQRLTNNLIEEMYSGLDIVDPEMHDLQGKIVELEEKIKALVPADDSSIFIEYFNQLEDLQCNLIHLELMKVYKNGIRDGINFYKELQQ